MDFKLTTQIDAENPVVHDLELRHGQLQWVGTDPSDADDHQAATAQRIKQHLLFVKGEWYQDQREGFPHWEHVFVAGVSLARVEALVRQCILGTPGVATIESLTIELDRSTRELSMILQATADDGTAIKLGVFDDPMIVEL